MGNYSKSILKVGGLSGNEGRKEIEDTFHEIDGVKSVKVNMNDSTVIIEFNPEIIREDFIKRTLNSLGYSPFIFS
ncbi:MAG: heavy-metal-associated domain-containing protein [Bacillota bacterium]